MSSVTCVIPCYNNKDTILRAVQSVLAQSVSVKEIILVDDASSDGSASLLDHLEADLAKVRVVSLVQNSGPARARNVGWTQSSGDWVAFLDADDAWHPQKIEIQLQAIRANPDLAIIGHGCEVSSEGKEWSDLSYLVGNQLANKVKSIGKWRIMASNPWPTPSVMIRRDVAERFDEDMRRAEDYLLWSRIVMGGGAGARINLDLARLYKPKFGAAGLSADLYAFEVAELEAIRRLRQAKLVSFPVAFGWSLFSLAKYLSRLVRSR